MSGIALVGGAGEGLGAALGRRFAKGGYEVVLSSRSQGERADLREEAQVTDLFDRVEKRGPIEVAIFNPGANFRAPIAETPAEMFEKVWRSSPPSPPRRAACGRWRSRWRASSGRRTSMSRTSSSTA